MLQLSLLQFKKGVRMSIVNDLLANLLIVENIILSLCCTFVNG